MTNLKVVQDWKVLFSWKVLYFSFFDCKIIFAEPNKNFVEILLLWNYKIYKNKKLRYKSEKSNVKISYRGI